MRDSLIFGKKFFFFSEKAISQDTSHTIPGPRYGWVRVDSSTCIIFTINSYGYEYPFLNLSMREGDVIEADSGTAPYRIEVLSEENAEVLGLMTEVKKYKKTDVFQSYLYDFAKEIGQIRYKINGDYGTDYDTVLKGAVIDNVVYGDTTTAQ